MWLYATRSTRTAEVLDRLKKQAATSATLVEKKYCISDRGYIIFSKEFEMYCKEEKIEHVLTTTGVFRRNGQE